MWVPSALAQEPTGRVYGGEGGDVQDGLVGRRVGGRSAPLHGTGPGDDGCRGGAADRRRPRYAAARAGSGLGARAISVEPAIDLSRSATRTRPSTGRAGRPRRAVAVDDRDGGATARRGAGQRARVDAGVPHGRRTDAGDGGGDRGARRGARRRAGHAARWLAIFGGLAVALLGVRGLYGSRLGLRLLDDVRAILAACAIAAMAVAMVRALAFPDGAAADQALACRGLSPPSTSSAAARCLNWSELTREAPRRHAPADADRRRRPRRAGSRPSGCSRSPSSGCGRSASSTRSPLDGTSAATSTCPCSARAGTSSDVVRRARRRAGDRHVLDRAARGAAPAGPAAARSSASQVAFVPRLFERMTDRARGRPPRRRSRSCAPATSNPTGLAVRGQVRARPRGRAALPARPALARAARRRARACASRSAGPSSSASPASAATAAVRDAQVPHDAAAPDDAEPASRSSSDTRAGRRRGRRPPHARRELPAPDVARRAAAAVQRPARRHEPRRAAPGAPGVRRALRASSVYRYGDRHRVKAGHHRLGAGQRPARQDVDLRPRRVGQLLHRELVALARPEDPADDRLGGRRGRFGRVE